MRTILKLLKHGLLLSLRAFTLLSKSLFETCPSPINESLL